jgi:hypothetical protein
MVPPNESKFPTIIGLDLAATFRKAKVGAAVMVKTSHGYELLRADLIKTSDEILAVIEGIEPPALLCIDAPLKLPINEHSPYGSIRK